MVNRGTEDLVLPALEMTISMSGRLYLAAASKIKICMHTHLSAHFDRRTSIDLDNTIAFILQHTTDSNLEEQTS